MKKWQGYTLFNQELWYLGKIVLDVLDLTDWFGEPHIEQCGDEFISIWNRPDDLGSHVWLITGSSPEPLGVGPSVPSKVMAWDLYGHTNNYLDLKDLSDSLFPGKNIPPLCFIQLHNDAD